MAKGRRDYTWGVLQDAILPGRYSVNWFRSASHIIEGVGSDTFISYTVPVGYKFFLTGVFVTCSSPQINMTTVTKDAAVVIATYFCLNLSADFASLGSYTFEAGEELKVLAGNFDGADVTFYVQAFGVLEQLV